MKLYVGLDVSLEETSLCVVDSEGQTVREVKVGTEPEAIRAALEGCADRLDRVGVEASSLGIWLYRELQPAGVPIIVVEARHMRVSLSTMRNKTDRNDARGIAQMMRLGWYRAVHVKNIDMQKMRTLLINRKLGFCLSPHRGVVGVTVEWSHAVVLTSTRSRCSMIEPASLKCVLDFTTKLSSHGVLKSLTVAVCVESNDVNSGQSNRRLQCKKPS
jgi:hypothetical protein